MKEKKKWNEMKSDEMKWNEMKGKKIWKSLNMVSNYEREQNKKKYELMQNWM